MALLMVLGYLSAITILSGALFALLHVTMSHGNDAEWRQVSLNLAEGGLDKAIAELRTQVDKGLQPLAGPDGYRGEQDVALGDGVFSVEVTSGDAARAYHVVSTGMVRAGRVIRAKARVAADLTFDPQGRIVDLRWQEVRSW